MSPCSRQQMAARLLSSPCLQHDQAQAALASGLSSTAMESPGALLDEASLSLFGGRRARRCRPGRRPRRLAHQRALPLPRPRRSPGAADRPRADPSPRPPAADRGDRPRTGPPRRTLELRRDLRARAVDGPARRKEMALVGPGSVERRPVAPAMRPRCPHQVARQVLLEVRAAGPAERGLRAARLLRILPAHRCAARRERGD